MSIPIISAFKTIEDGILTLTRFQYCEAQGKGRAEGRPRKITQRSFIDGGWWMVDIRDQTILKIKEFFYCNLILGVIYPIRADAHDFFCFEMTKSVTSVNQYGG